MSDEDKPAVAAAEDIDGNPIGPGIAPSDVLTENLTLEQAIDQGLITKEEVAAELAKHIQVEAEETEASKQAHRESMYVHRCPKGHLQHGACELTATSNHTGQLIARSGPICLTCQLLWLGQKFPTTRVPFDGELAEQKAKREADAKALAEARRARKAAKRSN